jgi:hypothetical protein
VAEIDVTDVLADPFIAGQKFVVVRRQQTVGTNGLVSITESRFNASGSVVPSGDNSLVREEAYSQQANSITVVTGFRLRGVAKTAGGASYLPDLVLWQDNYYIVRDLKDWTDFGAGMTEAECLSFNYVDQPPA